MDKPENNDEMVMGNVELNESDRKKEIQVIEEALKGIKEEDIKNSILNQVAEDNIYAQEQQTKKKKEIILPKIGTKFMVEGQSYKVTYLNAGRGRFSAEPCEGQY